MHTRKTSLVIVNYTGEINERATKLLMGSVSSKMNLAEDNTVIRIVISLKALKYEDNEECLEYLVQEIEDFGKKNKLSVSIVDYSIELFPILKKITRPTKVKLFKTQQIAGLFLDNKSSKRDISVLVYDKDEANSKKISQELSKFGYSITRANDAEDFQARLHESKNDVVVTHTALNDDFKPAKTSAVLMLSKKLIINLPLFMDTAVDTLVSFTELESKKVSHGIKCFDTSVNDNVICAVMQFKGDLDGFFTLIFPKDLAIIVMETLLGESIEENDIDSFKDGVSELCNIITGATKSALSQKDVAVIFDLPKAFTSLEQTNKLIGSNNGIWIEMELAYKPYYMFITK